MYLLLQLSYDSLSKETELSFSFFNMYIHFLNLCHNNLATDVFNQL